MLPDGGDASTASCRQHVYGVHVCAGLPCCCSVGPCEQAHVAPITHVDQVRAVVSILLESNKIRNATHPAIMAYRIAVPDKPGVFHQDYDDDGEAAAGGRLLHLLQVAGARCWVGVGTRLVVRQVPRNE